MKQLCKNSSVTHVSEINFWHILITAYLLHLLFKMCLTFSSNISLGSHYSRRWLRWNASRSGLWAARRTFRSVGRGHTVAAGQAGYARLDMRFLLQIIWNAITTGSISADMKHGRRSDHFFVAWNIVSKCNFLPILRICFRRHPERGGGT